MVIVSWNVETLLRACIESIEATRGGLSVEVIVVDNASTDETCTMLRREFPQVRLIEPGRNTGFSEGNNIGIAASSGRALLILNPDTVVLPGALPTLLAELDANPQVGVVAPLLLNSDGTVQSSRRRFPTPATAFLESTWLQPIAPRRVLDRFYMADLASDQRQRVDWASGAAFMVRRELIEAVGVFDTGFFMYSEEMDWQRRISAAGWEIIFNPSARIIHHGGKSSEQIVSLLHVQFQTSKIRYYRKHHSALLADALRIFLLGSYAMQWIVEGLKLLLRHRPDLRRARMGAYHDVLRSGLRG